MTLARLKGPQGPVLFDTDTAKNVTDDDARGRVIVDLLSLDVEKVRACCKGTYMARAIAIAALTDTQLERLWPPNETDQAPRARRRTSMRGMARIGRQVHPEAAAVLIQIRASQGPCRAAARLSNENDPQRQIAAAMAAITKPRRVCPTCKRKHAIEDLFCARCGAALSPRKENDAAA